MFTDPPGYTRTSTRVPYTTPVRSAVRRSGGPAVLAHPRRVALADRGHVGGHVVAQVEQRAEANDALGVVEVHPQHRHVGGPGDLPEAGLPALHPLARALRRTPVPEPVAAADQRRGLFAHALGRLAIHRDHAKRSEEHTP